MDSRVALDRCTNMCAGPEVLCCNDLRMVSEAISGAIVCFGAASRARPGSVNRNPVADNRLV